MKEEALQPLPPPLFLCPPSVSVADLGLGLRLSAPSLSRPRRISLGGHGVAAMWVPLHVTNAPDGLHLGAAGAKLVEMPVFALLEQVLAATVAGKLVAHPAEERRRQRRREERQFTSPK